MKQTVRISILICGLVGTYLVAAVPQVPALDGGPIITHPVNRMDGGPIITHPVTRLDGGPIITHPGR